MKRTEKTTVQVQTFKCEYKNVYVVSIVNGACEKGKLILNQ